MSGDSTTKLVGVEMASKEFSCKNASSAQPDLETVSSETYSAISGSTASPENAQMASKDVTCNSASEENVTSSDNAHPSSKDILCNSASEDNVTSSDNAHPSSKDILCNSASEDNVTRSHNAQSSSKDVPSASSPKHTLETLPPEILMEIFEHLNPFNALGLALASLVFSAVFKRTYPKIAHHFKDGNVMMGLNGPAQTFRLNGTYDINGISSDGKTVFVTPVETSNPSEREIEKKEKPKNRFLRWLRRRHL